MLEALVPIHPKMVHFPIALFMAAFLFELLSFLFRKKEFHQTAFYLYVFAALISPLVVRTGIWEVERLQLNHPLLEKHRMVALWMMWGALMSLPVLWLVQKVSIKYFRIIFIVILLSVAGLVTYVGHLGGEMVYEYGAGIAQ